MTSLRPQDLRTSFTSRRTAQLRDPLLEVHGKDDILVVKLIPLELVDLTAILRRNRMMTCRAYSCVPLPKAGLPQYMGLRSILHAAKNPVSHTRNHIETRCSLPMMTTATREDHLDGLRFVGLLCCLDGSLPGLHLTSLLFFALLLPARAPLCGCHAVDICSRHMHQSSAFGHLK